MLSAEALSTETFGQWLIATGLTLPRIGVAFLVMPLLTKENAPAMVRNSLYLVLAVLVLPLTGITMSHAPDYTPDWPLLLLKEMLIGGMIGFLFGSVFWALNIAGGFIDTQAGTNMANVIDPIQGHQSSPTSQFLAQFGAVLFMTSGAFMIFLDVLLSSYVIWPVQAALPPFSAQSLAIVTDEFGYMMTTALLFAAPAIIILAIIDMAFGLVNRFAQQINLLALTSPIKAWVSGLIVLLSLGMIVEVILRKLAANQYLNSVLQGIF